MTATKCALCGETRECLPKEIEGQEYDLCVECWEALSKKLSGKGKNIKRRMDVYIPQVEAPKEKEEPPAPGGPPRVWFHAVRPH